MSLGDLFPDNFKKDFADRNIDIGKAILMEVPDFTITYKKYIILIAPSKEDDCFGFVVINSEINENINRNAYLKQQHVLIDCARHSFLIRDSHVDCTEIKQDRIKSIKSYIHKHPECVCGNVEDDIIKLIHETLTLSRAITPKIKKRFGFL